MPEDVFLVGMPHRDWLMESPLSELAEVFVEYLRTGRYATSTIAAYLGVLAHFGHWAQSKLTSLEEINEDTVNEFVRSHLPSCRCFGRCRRHPVDARSSLKILLSVGRQHGVLKADVVPCTSANDQTAVLA